MTGILPFDEQEALPPAPIGGPLVAPLAGGPPRPLQPSDLAEPSWTARDLVGLGRLFAPYLVDYLTTPAPPPSYEPNAAGKIPPIGYHPGEDAAAAELFANLATAFIPGGSAAKVAMAPVLPAAAKVARQLATPGLAMTKAARHARAVEQGFTPGFWRGESTGAVPNEFPEGGWFSLDREVSGGHAARGGVKDRPFWLQLENVWQDTMPMTADKYGRVVEGARQVNPKLALDLAEQVAPGKGVDWVIGFGKAEPDFVMPIAPALIAREDGRSSTPFAVFGRAGRRQPRRHSLARGLHRTRHGRDVHMFGGKGIRHDLAMFDPAHLKRMGIYFGLGGAAAPLVLDQASQSGSTSGLNSSP